MRKILETKESYSIARTTGFPGLSANVRSISLYKNSATIAISPAMACLYPLFSSETGLVEWMLSRYYEIKNTNRLNTRLFSFNTKSNSVKSFAIKFKNSFTQIIQCSKESISFCIKNNSNYNFDCTKLSTGNLVKTANLYKHELGSPMKEEAQQSNVKAEYAAFYLTIVGRRPDTAFR